MCNVCNFNHLKIKKRKISHHLKNERENGMEINIKALYGSRHVINQSASISTTKKLG